MKTLQPKRFNLTGPCDPSLHYMAPALPRLPNVQGLIDDEAYFILHAPRQSGKTTVIRSAVDKINELGSYSALYCSLEELNNTADEAKAMSKLVSNIDEALYISEVKALNETARGNFWEKLKSNPAFAKYPVKVILSALRARLDKDLVVFFDEADCLQEAPLQSFLSQLRLGYIEKKKTPFPRSIALIGLRSRSGYRVALRPESKSLDSPTPNNIVADVLTLADFTEAEVKTLYAQHTEATGQVFEDEASKRAWFWSQGQPWLVNALAREAIEKILASDYRQPITAALIDQAADRLIRSRIVHIDYLRAQLAEPRLNRFIWPMLDIPGETFPLPKTGENLESFNDDFQYCLDLGLIKKEGDSLRPANPIYASVILRFFQALVIDDLPTDIIDRWLEQMDGLKVS